LSKLQATQEPSESELHFIVELYSQGELLKALSITEELKSNFPRSATLYNLCGAIHAALFHYALAIENYQRAIELEPDFADLYFNMASAQIDCGELDAAIKSYRRAIAIDPRYVEAYSDLGLALQEKAQWKEAIDCFTHALALDPNYADAHSNMASALQAIGNLDSAIAHCDKALAINPRFAPAHYNLGSVMHQKGKLAAALRSYKQAYAINATLAPAQVKSGQILHELGDLKGSIACLKSALAIDPNAADVHFSLATVLHDSGNLGDAHDAYKCALELNPHHSGAAISIAKLLYENQQYEQAAEIFALNQSSESQLYFLKCLYAEKREEEVVGQIKKLCAKGEHNAVIGSYISRVNNKYGINLHNPYCQNPLDFVSHLSLSKTVNFSDIFSKFASDLLSNEATDLRAQTLLTNGIQTAGNCLTQGGELGKRIEAILRDEIEKYRQHFAAYNEGLIRHWSENYRLYGWLVSVNKGGKLAAHMHDSGWLTGSVYINVPQKSEADSGNLVVSAEDVEDDCVITKNRLSVDVTTGSLCLFPSSLLHYTRPFDAKENRIVLAFDMIPER
jgi:tetratricopeptide (TPR) repeat protein